LAAISATTQICNTLVRFFNGVSVGAGAVISRYFGGREKAMLKRSIQTTMLLTFLTCVLLTVIGFFGADWMLRCMSTPEDVFQEASRYLHIYFAGLSGLLIYNMGSAILRAVGDSHRPLLFLLICSCCNILLDFIFVIFFRWGVAGAAFATILSQLLSAALVLFVLLTTSADWRLTWNNIFFDHQIATQILNIGLPVGLQMALVSFSNVFVQAYINAFDTACIAGWGCYTKLDQYMLLPIQSMGQTVTTFVGQNIGAKQLDRAKKGIRVSFKLTIMIAVTVAATLCAFARPLMGLFSPETEVIQYGTLFIRLCVPFATCCCFNQIFSGALRGAGNARVPMVITICTHVLMRQLYLLVISKLLPYNIYAIGFGYPVGWILCAALTTLYYRFSRWDEKTGEVIHG
jgi:putative MATE family efflux protein